MKVAVAYNEPVTGRSDSEDVLDELRLVIDALEVLGYDFKTFEIYPVRKKTLSLLSAGANNNPSQFQLNDEVCVLLNQLKQYSPSVIFNLVESIGDKQRFYPIIASLFELSGCPYTGSSFDVLLTTTDKILTKALMTVYDIPTPLWKQYQWDSDKSYDDFQITLSPPWIVKPAREDASVGIDDGSVVNNRELLISKISKMRSRYNDQPILIEEYIEGREFNISLFEHSNGTVEVLPVAEMVFANWPEVKPKIVDYRAKWDKNSFEYNNTVRRFDPQDAPLDSIKDLALRCWSVFGLRGYARVDMRMDKKGGFFVIELNTNPCIAPDSGFIMAVKEAGYEIKDVIKEILDVAIKSHLTKD